MTDNLRRDGDPFLLKCTEHISHIHHIVQHHRIGHQVPILDPLFLLYRIAAAQHRPPKAIQSVKWW